MDNLDGFDPGDWIIPRVERVHGLPRRYECDRLSDTDGTVVASPRAATSIIPNSTTLYFDYEFSLPHPGEPMDEVIMQDLPILEFGILRRLAIVSGLSECDLRKQLDDPALNPLLFDSNLVVGLSSAQPDKKTALGTFTRENAQWLTGILRITIQIVRTILTIMPLLRFLIVRSVSLP